MRVLLGLLLGATVLALAFWAYQENYRTREVVAEVRSVQAEIGRLQEQLNVLRAEWAHMAAEGPTQAELEEAVSYLTGSLPLQFTDSRRTASILMGQRRNGRPADWLAKRPERLAAMTRDGVARVAARVLQPGRLGAVVAGKPEGI